MALTQDRIIAILRQELTKAQGWDQDELAANREKAFNYFYNRPRGDEAAGRSQVQSSDVSDMIEAVLANIGPILTKETLIQFEASGEQDEDQAQLESDFVSYMVAGQNDGYVAIMSAVKDSLLLRNGFLHVGVETEHREERYTEDNLTEPQVQATLDSQDQETRYEIRNLEREGDTFKVSWTKITHKRELRVRAVAPENLLYSADHDTPYLSSCRVVFERRLLSQTDLLGMGYPKSQLEELPSIDADTKADATARRQDQDQVNEAVDPANRLIETWEAYAWIDKSETGEAELRHIHFAHNEILLDEPADWVPYATGSPFIVPHRVYGQSLYDKLRLVQDSKTDFLRQWHDNARRSNHVKLIYNPLTTEEQDVLSGRPGGIRSKDPGNVGQVQVNDMGASLMMALEYMDKIRTERGGASLDLAAAEMQLAAKNVGDMGVERQMSGKEKLAAMMTSVLANTMIREIYLLTHMTLRAQMPGELTAKLNGKWVRVDPSQWPERKKVNVMTGLSASEKMQRMTALQGVIDMQIKMLTSGQEGELVDKGNLHNAILDWCRTVGLENIEQYWIDPQSEEAQQAAQQKQQAQQQQAQREQEMIQQQAQLQQQIYALGAQLEKYKHDTELLFKYADARLDAEMKEAEIVGSAVADIEKAQRQFDNKASQQEAASNA